MPLGQVCREAQKEPEGTARSWHWLSCESSDLNFHWNIFNIGHKCALWVKWHWIVVISLSLRWRYGAYTCTRIFFLRCNCLRPMCFRKYTLRNLFWSSHYLNLQFGESLLSFPTEKLWNLRENLWNFWHTIKGNVRTLLNFDKRPQIQGIVAD